MTTQERKVLTKICNRLRRVSRVDWETGNVNDWADWAKRMRDTIRSTYDTLEGLVEGSEEEMQPHTESEDDFLSRNLDE